MAMARRASQRMSASIWPGFVDAMTALLLVLMFVLSIFMVVQAVLRDTISGQENELDQLATEVTQLAQALGLSQQEAAMLQDDLSLAAEEAARQTSLIDSLEGRVDDQSRALSERDAAIATFEDRVAALLSERDAARAEGARLAASLEDAETARETLLSEQEALNLALAQARDEIDAEAEAARLAAAKAEALEALSAELQAEATTREASLADALSRLDQSSAEARALRDTLSEEEARRLALADQLSDEEAKRLAEAAAAEELRARLGEAQTALSDEEAARLAEAAAAEALRAKLENADAELTAMTLALEEERAEAEETLTLLAAAKAVEASLDEELAQTLIALQTAEAAAGSAADLRRRLAVSETEREAADARTEAIRADLSEAEARLAELGETADARFKRLAEITTERDALAAEVADLKVRTAEAGNLREQLASALAARLAAEAATKERVTESERQEILLRTARAELAESEGISTEAQRQVEALNQQVATLRTELGRLQSLLDIADAKDAEASVEIQNLSGRLNTALARAASEQSRRAALEAAEAERLRAEAERLRAQAGDLEAAKSEFFGALRRILGDREGVRVVGDRFVFSSEVLFDVASATLSPEGRSQIAEVAGLLEEVAGDIPETVDWIIRVDGHTDNIPLSGGGRFADNWELSQARALSVVRYMTDELGFPPFRLAATGFGEYRPVDPGDSREARAANRRIEFKLTER